MLLSHEELIAELPKLAHLNAGERKKLNDTRRKAQLDAWKINETTETDPPKCRHPEKRRKTTSPHFDPGLVLLNCAALGDVEGVRRLLGEGVNPNVNNVDRITPLHQSCLENDDEITKLLIDADCDIDSLDNELWTPLHAAVSLANRECVELLLRHGANQLCANVDGQVPLDLCEDEDIKEIMERDLKQRGITETDLETARSSQETKFFNEVKLLLEKGGNADFQLLDNDATLLHVAAANGYVEVALYLLSKNCKVDVQDIDGWSPLHAASFWEEVDIIELLAAHGANFKLRTFCGELPSDLTEDEDIKNLLQRLSERSELMKRHPGVLRPSSVRGRLVSRMTTGEREDKRRESAELHSVFVEQIEQDITKAPDSWRVRAGKYNRSPLRDITFDNTESRVSEEPVIEQQQQGKRDQEMTDCIGSQRPSLERSSSLSDSTDFVLPPNETGLSSICENGEHGNKELKDAIPDHVKSPRSPIGEFQRSVDGSTFELISPSTDTLDSDSVWNSSVKQPPVKITSAEDTFTPMKVVLRKEKSVDDLITSHDDEFQGASQPPPASSLSRTTSLVQSKPPKSNNVKRFYSFRTDANDAQTPAYSPKPGSNNKSSYKARKKSVSNKQECTDEGVCSPTIDNADTVNINNNNGNNNNSGNNVNNSNSNNSNSVDSSSSSNNTQPVDSGLCLAATQPSLKEVDHESISLTTLRVVQSDSPGNSMTTNYQPAPDSSSFPDNSMDTHAGSLDRPPDPSSTVVERKKEKTRKCCVVQ